MCWQRSSPGAAKRENITFSCQVGDVTFMTHSIASVWWDVVCLMFEALGWNQFGLVSQPSPPHEWCWGDRKHASVILNRLICTKSYLIVACAGISSKAKVFISHYFGTWADVHDYPNKKLQASPNWGKLKRDYRKRLILHWCHQESRRFWPAWWKIWSKLNKQFY